MGSWQDVLKHLRRVQGFLIITISKHDRKAASMRAPLRLSFKKKIQCLFFKHEAISAAIQFGSASLNELFDNRFKYFFRGLFI